MVMIVGHRGARNLWPENSLSGFRKLIGLGVEAVEFDVHETRDKTLVVIHDATLERTTAGQGAIGDLDAAQVLAAPLLDESGAADPNECVPSLDAVLDLLRDTSLELHVEIKTNAFGEVRAGMVERVINAVQRHGVAQRAILTCFVPEVLDDVQRVWAGARVLASLDLRAAEMLGGVDAALQRYASMRNCIVAVEKTLLQRCWSRCFETLGRERLGVWVVNEPTDLERWSAMPVCQITSDRPDLALAARERLRGSCHKEA